MAGKREMAYTTIGRIAHVNGIHLALTGRSRQGYDRCMVLKRFLPKWPLRTAARSHWRVVGFAILVVMAVIGLAAFSVRGVHPRRAVQRAIEFVYTRPMRAVYAVPERIMSSIWPQTQSSSGQARVQIPTDFYDFGLIGARSVVHRDFLIVNQGSAPLVILQAYTTCGCTSAELTATIIPPGKASRVTVTFDAGLHPVAGQTVRRGLVLETNDPTRPEAEIWVQASVGTK